MAERGSTTTTKTTDPFFFFFRQYSNRSLCFMKRVPSCLFFCPNGRLVGTLLQTGLRKRSLVRCWIGDRFLIRFSFVKIY